MDGRARGQPRCGHVDDAPDAQLDGRLYGLGHDGQALSVRASERDGADIGLGGVDHRDRGGEPVTAQRQPRKVTVKARETFLETLSGGWPVAWAAKAAGFERQRFYELRKTDKTFASAWAEAIDAGVQVLEKQALEIALNGVLEEVRDGDGNLVTTRRRPDPQMVRFLLQSYKSEVYSEKARVEVTGAGGGPVELAADYRPTSIADVVRLAADLGVATIDGEAHEAEPLALEEAS